jgi:peroxiredoxin
MTDDQSRDDAPDSVLAAGTKAPAFTLKSAPGRSYSLSDFGGKPLVMAFYPADWSPVCGDQMALYNEMRDEFASYGAQLVGVSVDGEWCHKAFAEARGIRFPLLADFEPKGQVSRQYGAYDRQNGVSERALFVIDGAGVIRWSYLSPAEVNPGADGILVALDKITVGDELRPRSDAETSREITAR